MNVQGSSDFYDDIADLYDIMVDWEKRLKREGPFFQKVFQEHGVRRILDSAAAGGRHVRYFRESGYETQGADFSRKMIIKCRQADPDHAKDYFQSDFRNLADSADPPYDAVLCLGCSLPHLTAEADLLKALANFSAILKPGGILITQFVNFDRIYNSGDRIRPLNHAVRGEVEYFFLRVYDLLSVEKIIIHLNILIKKDLQWDWKGLSTTLRPIFSDCYRKSLEQTGFDNIKFYGDYIFSPFNKDTSGDLVMVGRK